MKMESFDLSRCSKKNFESIDIMKFLCAILVVAIHISPLGSNDSTIAKLFNYGIQHYLARIAVPFFFMCTGFLVFRKTELESFSITVGIQYAKKTYKLYLLWTLIYSPFIIKGIMSHNRGVIYGLIGFIRNFLFVGSYTHLWYLNASAFAVLLISILLYKRIRISWIVGGGLVLYLIGLLPQSYFGLFENFKAYPFIWNSAKLFEKIIVTTRNGLFEACLFVGLGMLLAYKPIQLSAKVSSIGFCCSMLFMLFEVAMLTYCKWIRGYDMYLFLVPSSFFLFYFVSHIEVKNHRIYRFLRLSSSLIYFTHLWINSLVGKAYTWGGIDASRTGLQFITSLVLSILVSYLIITLSKCKYWGWLKKLYS